MAVRASITLGNSSTSALEMIRGIAGRNARCKRRSWRAERSKDWAAWRGCGGGEVLFGDQPERQGPNGIRLNHIHKILS